MRSKIWNPTGKISPELELVDTIINSRRCSYLVISCRSSLSVSVFVAAIFMQLQVDGFFIPGMWKDHREPVISRTSPFLRLVLPEPTFRRESFPRIFFGPHHHPASHFRFSRDRFFDRMPRTTSKRSVKKRINIAFRTVHWSSLILCDRIPRFSNS